MTTAPAPTLRRVLPALARTQAEQTLRRAATRLGARRPSPVTLAAARVPDTPTATAARQLALQVSPPPLAAHNERTYAFGSMLGRAIGVSWDAELLYVAAMLHDLGLTTYASAPGPFELNSAAAAEQFGREHGWPAYRLGGLHDAIALHLRVDVPDRSPEAALLHLGAACDVTGLRVEDLPRQVVEQVVHDFPRAGFPDMFSKLLLAEAHKEPQSYTALLCRWGQFQRRTRRAPLPYL